MKSLVALRDPGALEVDAVFDDDTKPGNPAVSCRPYFDAGAEGKAGELRVGTHELEWLKCLRGAVNCAHSPWSRDSP